MDAACNLVYVDRSVRQERMVRRGEAVTEAAQQDDGASLNEGARRLQKNLETLLQTFSKVYVCPTGLSCLARIARLSTRPTAEMVPTLVLIDIPENEDEEERRRSQAEQASNTNKGGEPSAPSAPPARAPAELYGSRLLQRIITDAKEQGVAKMVVPVAVTRKHREITFDNASSTPTHTVQSPQPSQHQQVPSEAATMQLPENEQSDMRYVDLGAVDVLDNPIRKESLPSLAIHVYRVHKEFIQRGKHLSAPTQKHEAPWPGVPTPEPFAYLREVMVSDLSGQICGSIVDHPVEPVVMNVSDERQQFVIDAISEWNFSAHALSEDELLYAAFKMMEHGLAMPEVEEFKLTTDNLLTFLAASRNGYNAFVPYHNFRHVVDVLQAVFHLLVRIGALPPFPAGSLVKTEPKSKLAKLLRPMEALSLLITAIGHDVGHPGVNNMFLVKIKAPLARLYNDKSVLESYHTAVYCHILKRLWPAVVDNEDMKLVMASSILSTDMGIHNEYMEKLAAMQATLRKLGDTDAVADADIKTFRHLACNLLIKCADISNVARPFSCAETWTYTLTDEFHRQAGMENQISLPSTLFAPPATDIVSLGKSQTGFMTFFALPLFEGVAELMPTTKFCVEEIKRNHALWTARMEETTAPQNTEETREREGSDDSTDNGNQPATESNVMGTARGLRVGGLSGGSTAVSTQPRGGPVSPHPDDVDNAGQPPPLSRGQPPQSNSRPNSRPVTWDEASANSRPATSSSARRVIMPDAGQVVTHRRSETTDGSASVPESNGWEGSARTADSGKSDEKAECVSTARTSVESSGMRSPGGMNGVNGSKRKSLVGSVSTPDLRSDSEGRTRHIESARRRERDLRKKGEKGDKGDGVFASMRELRRHPSLGKFKFWKKNGGREMQPPMPNVMGRRGREGGVSVG